MEQEPRIYVYKMCVDNGGAPCVWRGLWSLAICKPEIRRMAEVGSVIFGFGSKRKEYKERLLYIAVVTEKPPIGSYYQSSRYAKRPDCIYELGKDGETAVRKPTAKYHAHSDELNHDVGMKFEKAEVLLSTHFRYFGKSGTDDYKQQYPAIKAIVESMGRGHRVNHHENLRDELLHLKRQMWSNFTKKKLGAPTSQDQCTLCNRSGLLEECS